MARKAQDVTDAELAVLEVLWDHGTTTVRTIAETLYPQAAASHHATVQKLLERLEAKEFVTHHRGAWPHQFQARVARAELVQRRLESMAEQLCGGSFEPLLTQLVSGGALSKRERASLRKLLEESPRKGNA
jgi:predicted transcriptional regulator